ncbi:hypothetical protein VKT23_018359 [Stygiomarasmius scandens]|uniref:PIN-like protein n=1 Tax=Marasmiellus scandens TaxID=2682957 RepID=A0ABR1IPG3_9AGAR
MNLAIPLMISIRIWTIRRKVTAILGSQKDRNNWSIALCLETGIVYPLALVPSLIVSVTKYGDVVATPFPVLLQVVCIAPTLIIVRSELGISIDSVENIVRRGSESDPVTSQSDPEAKGLLANKREEELPPLLE